MCGIAGIVSSHRLQPCDRSTLAAMNRHLLHRGPDAAGQFESADASVAFAMRRLAIIDVGNGKQPLSNEDGTIWLVANGEIYNYVELRAHLRSRGHNFLTGSDCETIIHAYEEYGDDCVRQLRGMFAFALYDSRRKRVLIARDRLGEKPLYLHESNGSIYFASEAKALVGAGLVPFEMEPMAILQYLHWGFVPEPLAAIKNVRKLPAGHLLTIELPGFQVKESCYWDARKLPEVSSFRESAIRDELDEVAELTVRSDVNVGVCLSGGLDSSAVAALAQRKYPGLISAVSVGYSGVTRQDERAAARRFAEYLGIPFGEVVITPEVAANTLPLVAAAQDEPMSDRAGIAIYCLMEHCRAEGLTVMLNGLGGDELFWGYPWTRRALELTVRRQTRLSGIGSPSYGRLERFPRSYTKAIQWARDLGGIREELRHRRNDLKHPDRLVFWDQTAYFKQAQQGLPKVAVKTWLDSISADAPFYPFTVEQIPENLEVEFTCLLLETYLRQNGLAQADRISMAHSVELRCPLVDYQLVELVLGMRRHRGDSDLLPKQRLLQAIDPLLPAWVKERPKAGFSNPWRAWSREIARKHGFLLIDGELVQTGILRPEAGAQLRHQLDPGLVGVADGLAEALLSLELWGRAFRALEASARDVRSAKGHDSCPAYIA